MGSSSLLSSSDSSKSNSLLLGLLFTSSAGMLGFAKKDISLWSLAKTRSRSCLLIFFRSIFPSWIKCNCQELNLITLFQLIVDKLTKTD